MSAQGDDYDKLTKEEREARDAENRKREAEEQAGMWIAVHNLDDQYLFTRSLALPYKWSQKLDEAEVIVPVPKGTRGRDLVVVLQKRKLSVGFKGKEPIMSGELFADIKVEDSTWTLGRWSRRISALSISTWLSTQRIKRQFAYPSLKSTSRNGGPISSRTTQRSIPPRSSLRIASWVIWTERRGKIPALCSNDQ